MKKLAVGILAFLLLSSIAAPARADLVVSPVDTITHDPIFPVVALSCLGVIVIAAIIVGIVFIVRHNKKKVGK